MNPVLPPTTTPSTAPVRAAMDLGGLVVRPRHPVGPGPVDDLTGLPGREAMAGRTADAFGRTRPDEHGIGVVHCGVDRFAGLNYRLGRAGGDAVLRVVAGRLATATAGRGQLFRLGGDEFAVLVSELRHPGDLRALGAAMLRAVRHPMTVPGLDGGPEVVSTTVSVGMASVGWDGAHRDLLREADLAQHRAKDLGRDRVVVFDEELRAGADEAVAVERRLRHALAAGHARLYLQPVVDLGTGDHVSSEGLVRLVDGRGLVSLPGSFIGVAEDRGLVSEIDRWGIQRAVELIAADAAPAVAINLSARTFDRIDVLGRVAGALDSGAVDPTRLHLEVTESSLAQSGTSVVSVLESLRDLGCPIAIDDFGTGYSSLAHLASYPADALKIDRSFVTGLGRGVREDAVVQAAVDLGHAHGMVVVAEGVERQEQARLLRQMGCDRAQGWFFGRPADPQR